MWQRNNGKGEENVLQNQFTRYLITAIEREKAKYQKRRSIQSCQELLTDLDDSIPAHGPWDMSLELFAVYQALNQVSKRDQYIFLARVLDQRGFDELAIELNMSYKSVSTAYYRVVQKLRNAL